MDQHSEIHGESSGNAWGRAFAAHSALIRAHPLFHDLIREVAIAEQPGHPGLSWASRNSRTYGSWMTREMPRVDTGPNRRRAIALARKIADDIGLYADWDHNRHEATARTYGEARDFVSARLR